jgi:AraC family transcriptional regulator
MRRTSFPGSIEDVAPLLADVGQSLDQDMSLGSLARDFGASPFQFHRFFSATVGETPKQHVSRLRLERAAYKLAITEETVLNIGLSVGFNTHETFSRAFRRRFGAPPSAYRRRAKAMQRERMERNRAFRGDGCLISEVRFETVRPAPALAIRHVGAYSGLDEATRRRLWDEILAWAAGAGVACSPLRIGLFPDDPTMTPAELQQSDLCIPITAKAQGSGRIRPIQLTGGWYGIIDHLGPGGTVGQAYRNLADGIRASGRYVLREEPPIHVFLPSCAEDADGFSRSKVMFPVRAGP